jgi:ketosteroid isomerase-like protein
VDVLEFAPLSFAANDTDVMAVIGFGVKSKATGRSAEMELHHWWQFRDGKVFRYRGSEDTALTAAVLAP